MTFGERLKLLRIDHGLTQTELAEKIKLSKANVSKYESDTIEPNFDTLKTLSSLFDVSIDYLLCKTDNKNVVVEKDSSDDIKEALFGGAGEVTDEMWDEVKRFADFVMQKEKEKNKEKHNKEGI